MAKAYNGHRSWNSWNISLWMSNDENTYRYAHDLVKRYGIRGATQRLSRDMDGERTPDGARYNPTCIREFLSGCFGVNT